MGWILFVVTGFLAGILGGFFGVGGAIIIIPLLVFGAKFSQHLAQGTALGALLFPIGLLATWKYWQNGYVNIPASLWIAVGFLFGGWIGAHFAQTVGSGTLRKTFAVLLIGIGLKLFLGK